MLERFPISIGGELHHRDPTARPLPGREAYPALASFFVEGALSNDQTDIGKIEGREPQQSMFSLRQPLDQAADDSRQFVAVAAIGLSLYKFCIHSMSLRRPPLPIGP